MVAWRINLSLRRSRMRLLVTRKISDQSPEKARKKRRKSRLSREKGATGM